jgi:hypothetical protein
MRPPYDITPEILRWVSSISEKIGEANALFLSKPSPQLRKQNQIKTIHSSLQIEGNTLTEDQITALLENKRVIGPQKDILEVLNAVKVYEDLGNLVGILAVFWGISAFAMGFLSDRIGRRNVLVPAIVIFSLMSAFSGMVSGLVGLLVIRAIMGIAEGPVASTGALRYRPEARQDNTPGACAKRLKAVCSAAPASPKLAPKPT